MISAALTPIVYVAVILGWISAGMLIRISRRDRLVVALSERAFASVALALFMTLFAVALLNVDLGYPWLDSEGGRILVRLAAILPLLIPARWLVRYWRGWR